MSKADKPSLRMVVQDRRLAPGGIYEQEVLDTYPNGAELHVTMRQPRSLPLNGKYWSILRDLVENTDLSRFGEGRYLHNAIKIKLGMIDFGKTFSGQRYISVGSTSFDAMDEAEFRRFYDKAMAILAEETGIDPDTLSDRYRHIPEQDSSGETSSARSPDEAAPASRPVGAATTSAPAPATEDGGNPAAVAPPADIPTPTPRLSADGARSQEGDNDVSTPTIGNRNLHSDRGSMSRSVLDSAAPVANRETRARSAGGGRAGDRAADRGAPTARGFL